MSEGMHARAERLMLERRVETILQREQEWLDQHLETCPDCNRLARSTEKALRSLQAISVPLPAALASRAQLRVYLRARELRTRERSGWLLWIWCGLSWAMGLAIAPYVWRGFEWAGHCIGVPNMLWEMGFGLWWALPALIAAGILLIEKPSKSSSEPQ